MSEILTPEKISQHIFQRWAAELRNKDRRWDNVRPNFEDLFFEMFKSDIPFDIAHQFLKPAVAKHLPNAAAAKNTWNRVKGMDQNAGLTFQEWLTGWKQGIEDVGIEAFYSIYSPPAQKTEEVAAEEKQFGSMSKKEYRLQRRYAESFPILNTDELVKRLEDGVDNYEDFFKGIATNVLEKKNGNN